MNLKNKILDEFHFCRTIESPFLPCYYLLLRSGTYLVIIWYIDLSVQYFNNWLQSPTVMTNNVQPGSDGSFTRHVLNRRMA